MGAAGTAMAVAVVEVEVVIGVGVASAPAIAMVAGMEAGVEIGTGVEVEVEAAKGSGCVVWMGSAVVTIRTPEGPYFLFSRALYPFPTHSHTCLHFPTTSRALLTICSIFPALMRDLPFLVARIPGLYLVRIPALVIVA